MSNKILFCTGEGVGNVIQTIPAIRTIREVAGFELDFWHAFGTFRIPKIIPYVDKWVIGAEIRNINFSRYKGIVSTKWTMDQVKSISKPLLTKITDLSMTRSEVDCYMDIARQLGVSEENLIWRGKCLYRSSNEYYDVVIHNGYNYRGASRWELKSYPRYRDVVGMLDAGISVCSIGSKNEHIPGTINKTGMDLLSTLGIIKNTKVFVGNDSGLYHCANALDVDNIVIFTYTSTDKNYDARFHVKSVVICREDLECRWCQNEPRLKTCTTRECRNISPELIVNKIMEMLNG